MASNNNNKYLKPWTCFSLGPVLCEFQRFCVLISAGGYAPLPGLFEKLRPDPNCNWKASQDRLGRACGVFVDKLLIYRVY